MQVDKHKFDDRPPDEITYDTDEQGYIALLRQRNHSLTDDLRDCQRAVDEAASAAGAGDSPATVKLKAAQFAQLLDENRRFFVIQDHQRLENARLSQELTHEKRVRELDTATAETLRRKLSASDAALVNLENALSIAERERDEAKILTGAPWAANVRVEQAEARCTQLEIALEQSNTELAKTKAAQTAHSDERIHDSHKMTYHDEDTKGPDRQGYYCDHCRKFQSYLFDGQPCHVAYAPQRVFTYSPDGHCFENGFCTHCDGKQKWLTEHRKGRICTRDKYLGDNQKETTETVNHPPHYGGDTTYEAIKVIEAWQLGFCLGNVVKYISRADSKGNALEDLKKSAWYLAHEIEERERLGQKWKKHARPESKK